MQESKIREILKETAPATDWDAVKVDDSLDAAGLDSLDKASVIMAIETEAGIHIDDDRYEDLDTIAALAAVDA